MSKRTSRANSRTSAAILRNAVNHVEYAFERLETRTLLAVTIRNGGGSGYVGLGGSDPPDTCGAAGPSSYIEVINGQIEIFKNKALGTPTVTGGLNTFMFTTGGLTVQPGRDGGDSSIVYDDLIGRFIIGDLDADDVGNTSNFNIGVSTSNNPTNLSAANWKFYTIATTEGSNWTDYPGNIGFNADAVVLTFNMAHGTGLTGDAQVVSINAADLANGVAPGSLHIFHNDISGSRSYRPVAMHDAQPGDPMWLVRNPDSGNSINVTRMTNVLSSSASFTTTPLSLPAAKNFSTGDIAPKNPDGSSINDIDFRILKAGEYNDTIVATHKIKISGNEAGVQWYAIDVSGTPALATVGGDPNVGRISSGPNTYCFDPGIDINAAGEIGLTFMESDTTGGAITSATGGFVSTFVTARRADDTAGEMDSSLLVPTGTGTGKITDRSGDFSGMNIDPADGTFWGVNEWGNNGNGGTAIANLAPVYIGPPVLQIDGDRDFAGEDDTFRLVIDPNDSSLLDVYVNGILRVYTFSPIQQINVNGFGGNDRLITDSSNGLISVPNDIRYDGGSGFDGLSLDQTGGATQTFDSYTPGPNTGEGISVIVGASGTQRVFFEDLAPVIDTVPATTLTVNGTPSDNAIDYRAGSLAGRGLVTIDNFESIEFSSKTNLTINAGSGSDVVNLNNPSTPTGLSGVITVSGADPATGDSLVVNGIAGAPDNLRLIPTAAGAGTVVNDSAPQPNVVFSEMEHLTMAVQSADGDGARVEGTTGNDRVEFFSDSSGTGNATLAGTMDQNNATGAGPFAMVATTVTGLSPLANDTDVNFFNPGGSDNFIFNGTPGNDTIAVGTGEAGGAEFRNTIDGQIVARVEVFNIASAIVRGLDGANTINYTALGTPLPLTIDGGGGATANLTGNGTAMAATLGSTSNVTGGGLGAVTLLGVNTINLNAGAGAIALTGSAGLDVFTLTVTGVNTASVQDGPLPLLVNTTNTGALSFDGGAQSTADSFTLKTTGAAAVAYQPTSASGGNLTAGATSIALSNIHSLSYDGQGGNAALSLNGSGGDDSFVHTPAAAGDAGIIAVNSLLPLSYQNLGAGGSLTVNGNAGSDTLVYNGTAAGDSFNVNGAGDVGLNARLPVSTAGVETLTLQGLGGDDTFTLVPAISASPYAVINFIGGESSAGDVANFIGTAGADDFNISGTSLSQGGKTVNSPGVETENLNAGGGVDSLHYSGVAGVTEAINVAASPTAGSGRIYATGLMNVVFGNAELVDVNGNLPDNDTLTVFATNNVDVINIHADAVGTAAAPVLQVQTATAATLLTLTNYTGIQTLGVDALDGQDVINVYTGPTIGRNLQINGNAPTAKKKLTDLLNVFYVFPKPHIIASTTTQSPQSGLVNLDYGTSKTLVQYLDIENVVIRKQ